METFQIDFRREATTVALSNSYGFTGTGELSIGSPMALRGQRRKLISPPREVELQFDLEQVANVQRDGKSLSLDVLPGGIQKPGFITLTAQDEATAIRIVELLPARTFESEQPERALSVFNERLIHVTPHVFVTQSLVAINVIVFAAMVAAGVDAMNPDGATMIAWGSDFGPLTTSGQRWRLFTSMFLHFGFVHLGVNMWALYVTGRVVERLYGNARFGLLYVIAGLAGSVASLLWNPMVNSAGASGAIFGVYGALIAFMLDARNRVPESAMKAQRSAAIVFLLNSLVYGMTHEGIDNAAHLGGLVGGFAMAFLLARPLDPEARATRDVRRLCIVVAGAAAVLMLSALPIKNTFETYRKDSQYRADLEWFDKEQDRLFAAAEQWAQLADSQSLSSGDLADRLERDVVSHWQAIQDRLSKTPLDEGSSLRRHQVLVLEYVASHHDGYRLLAEGTRADDATKLEQADARFKASNAVITKLEQFTLTDDE